MSTSNPSNFWDSGYTITTANAYGVDGSIITDIKQQNKADIYNSSNHCGVFMVDGTYGSAVTPFNISNADYYKKLK